MSSNYTLPPLPSYTLHPQPPIVPGIPDSYLALLLPILAYWGVSFFFHVIDEHDIFPQYRLHTPAEVLKRNHVSRWEVFRDVVLQQVIQTIFGVVMTLWDPEPMVGKEEYDVAVWAQRIRMAQRALPGLVAVMGFDSKAMSNDMMAGHPVLAGLLAGGQYGLSQETEQGTVPAFASWEILAAKMIYHFGIPALQFAFAIMWVDTWQYFWHRAMHLNKWLYTTFHSRHHRLYVPYAYGALYNHPFEGFLLDTLGAGLAYLITGMTARQSIWFFTCSTIKTVDDHCGYALPFDPLQHLTSNNAGYHDVHHQSWGIKTNFSQPFFTVWDRILGTMWTGGDVSARYERARLAAQKKVDTASVENKSVTQSTSADSTNSDPTPYSHDDEAATTEAKIAHARSQSQIAVPPGKAQNQSLDSRQQVLDDTAQPGGGASVIREEAAEERDAQILLRRSPRKKSGSAVFASPMKELRNRVNTSLHGKGSGVLGVESGV